MPNIRVNLWVCAYDGETNLSGEAYGYTNQYGYAIVTYYIDGEYDPELEFMEASVMNPPYSTLYATGNRTTSSSTIYPEFWIIFDEDQNGIHDQWEIELAEKFSPTMKLHHPTAWVAPEPVEIMNHTMYWCVWDLALNPEGDYCMGSTDNLNYSGYIAPFFAYPSVTSSY